MDWTQKVFCVAICLVDTSKEEDPLIKPIFCQWFKPDSMTESEVIRATGKSKKELSSVESFSYERA